MDNNGYITKTTIDTFIHNASMSCDDKEPEKIDISKLKQKYGREDKPCADVTFSRDLGLFSESSLGDSARLYQNGLLSFSELVFELLFKRNAYKADDSRIKPVVMICYCFNIIDLRKDVKIHYKINQTGWNKI